MKVMYVCIACLLSEMNEHFTVYTENKYVKPELESLKTLQDNAFFFPLKNDKYVHTPSWTDDM